jgi:hypothetical protein
MFQEDVELVGHFWRFGLDEEPTLRLQGSDEERGKASTLCGSIRGDHCKGPEENVKSAIQEVVLHLVHYGRALFEIVAGTDRMAPSLDCLNPDHVWDLVFFYLQAAPRECWRDLDRKYVLLEKSAVWRIDMPQELGGTRGFKRILKGLSAWSGLGPAFYQDDLEKRRLPREFAFGDYRRAHQLELYRVTRSWGWNSRDWSLDYVTEYYQFYRHLTFKWAQAILREQILTEFNSLFRRLGISAQLVAEALSSPGDILKIRDQMEAGVLDFAGATKAIR